MWPKPYVHIYLYRILSRVQYIRCVTDANCTALINHRNTIGNWIVCVCLVLNIIYYIYYIHTCYNVLKRYLCGRLYGIRSRAVCEVSNEANEENTVNIIVNTRVNYELLMSIRFQLLKLSDRMLLDLKRTTVCIVYSGNGNEHSKSIYMGPPLFFISL